LLADVNLPDQAFSQALSAAGIRNVDIRPIAPSLEDVFVTLTAHQERLVLV
jgi:hypothetical protein